MNEVIHFIIKNETLVMGIVWSSLSIYFINLTNFLICKTFFKNLLILNSILAFLSCFCMFAMPIFAIFLAIPFLLIAFDTISIALNKEGAKILIFLSLIQIVIMIYIIGTNFNFFGGNKKYLVERVLLLIMPVLSLLSSILQKRKKVTHTAILKICCCLILAAFWLYAPDRNKEKVDKIFKIEKLKEYLESNLNIKD